MDAARGYDIAALACKGHHVPTNFGLASYKEELVRLGNCSKVSATCCQMRAVEGPFFRCSALVWGMQEEIVAHVRRSSSAFSRGRSIYRGVSGQDNRWEARIGTFDSRKNVRMAPPAIGSLHLLVTSIPRTPTFALLGVSSDLPSRPPPLCHQRCLEDPVNRDTCSSYIVSFFGKSKHGSAQVSFGIHETEEKAARQYDRALIIEKGRAAKTNFPLTDYELEVDQYEAVLLERSASRRACL